jgi:hypothetical protein
MKRTLITLMLCLFATAVAADDAQVVDAAYPQRLLTEYADYQDGTAPPAQLSDFAFVGDDLLAAAYTNGFTGAILLLRRDGTVALDPSLHISGVVPSVETVNLDGTGNEEVIVSFSSPRGRDSNWIFRREGETLALIGPSAVDEDGDLYPTIVDAGWLDLDGDGSLELYAPSGNPGDFDAEPQPPSFVVYTLTNGQYAPAGSLSYARRFERTTAAPNDFRETFLAQPGAHTLKIANDGVSSATVRLNGADIVTPNMLNPNVRTITVDVTLQSSNTIEVELASAPGSSLTVGIAPK